jgi:hypothetical protein
MTDQQGGTQPVGWRPPEPASEATFVPPPPPPAAPPPAPGWPPPDVGSADAGWQATQPVPSSWPPPPASSQPPAAWPPPEAGWAPPASATASWPQAAARPRTSILVVLAGIFLLVVGLLTSGMGGILLLGSALFSAAEGTSELETIVGGDLAGAFVGMFAVVGLVTLLWGLFEMVGALGMFAHRGWGRAIGIVAGVLGLLLWGLSLLSALGSGAEAGSLAFTGILLAGYGLTVVALITGGEHFRRA